MLHAEEHFMVGRARWQCPSTPPVCRGFLSGAAAFGQVSLALRSVSRGAPPPVPFVVVASVSTAVLLIGWRAAFAALSSRGVVRPRARQPSWLCVLKSFQMLR